VGLALASALVVLIASGVAVSRLGSDDRPDRSSQTASPARPLERSAPVPAAPGPEGPGPAVSSTPAPVPPPVPAPNTVRRPGAKPSAAPVGSPGSAAAAGGGMAGKDTPPADATASDDPGSTDPPTQGSATGGSAGSPPPSPQGEPDSAALLAASVSVGEGSTGAVVGAGLGDAPEADVTVGDSRVVGDAPPSGGTAVDLGGRFLHPPPTVPTLPG
jgi:hypothetical protein